MCLAKSSTAQTDELGVVVAIEVWGAHAPSRAVVGASLPGKRSRGDHAGLKSSEKLRTFVQLFTSIRRLAPKARYSV